jgi:hypothetical protein
MYVLQVSKHAPESCPVFNEHTRGPTVALMQKMDSLLAKHGVKPAGMWNDHGAHETYIIHEAPNMETFIALAMEPEMIAWLSFNTVETKVVFGREEVKAMLNLA